MGEKQANWKKVLKKKAKGSFLECSSQLGQPQLLNSFSTVVLNLPNDVTL